MVGDTPEEIQHMTGRWRACKNPNELTTWVEGHNKYGNAPKGYQGTYLTFPVRSFMLLPTPKSDDAAPAKGKTEPFQTVPASEKQSKPQKVECNDCRPNVCHPLCKNWTMSNARRLAERMA